MSKWTFLFFLFWSPVLLAQQALRVDRCGAVNRDAAVRNVFIDAENNRWVSNREGVFQVLGPDLSTPLALAAGEESLLAFPDGNYNLKWPAEKLRSALGQAISKDNIITTAAYDSRKKELWIGTSQTGLFQLSVEPELRLLQNHTTKNSKLKSDYINTITIDPAGRLWIGTRDGLLVGESGRWKLLERYFDFRAIAVEGAKVWLMTADMIGPMEKDVWYPIEIPERQTEGELQDLAFDWDGNLWISSEIVTRYEPAAKKYTVFGPAQEFTSQFAANIAVDQDGAVWVGSRDKGLFVIQKAAALAVAFVLEKPVDCQGNGKDAALRVEVGGGQAPYTYRWDPAVEGNNPKNLAPGSYQVTVTDAKGQTRTAKIDIPDTRITLTLAQEQPESGPGNADGRATARVSGGKGGYSFRWDNGETAATAVKLSGGKHSLTVTDKSGCVAVAELELSQQAAPLVINIVQTSPVLCSGGKEAALKAEVLGGKAPYSFQWSDKKTTAAEIRGLAAGTYQVTVTDGSGNTRSAELAVQQPEPIKLSTELLAPADLGKANGLAIAKVSGGKPDFSFRWDNGELTQEAKVLAAGTRQVTVTDGAGCTATATVQVVENVLPLAVNLAQTKAVSCNGAKDGSLQVEVRGGKGPYQYQWNNPRLAGQTVAGLSAAAYQVTVTDAAGNSRSAEFTLNQPNAIQAIIDALAPAGTGKSDGRAVVKASGGTAPFSYQWDNGETKAEAQALAPGKRQVTITDASGCTATASIDITENILPLAVRLTQSGQIRCNGGKDASVQVDVSGGKGPFQYAWSQSGLSGAQAANLGAGAYQVTVTDAAGTKKTAEISIAQPDALSASINALAPASTDKSDGRAAAKVSGGTAPFSYQWDNGETAAEARALAPGKRQLTVTDASGCTATASIDITENILPLALKLNLSSPIKCYGGKDGALRAEVSGGKGPFQYSWSTGGAGGAQLNNLGAGDYSLTLTDAIGKTQTASLSLSEPDSLSVKLLEKKPASTEDRADGRARIQVSGGKSPYSFRWDNGETAAQAEKLAVGKHQVTVSDANGCQSVSHLEITPRIIPELAVGQVRSGQTIQMQKLQFEADSTRLTTGVLPVLDELLEFLKENPTVVVEIAGHTNSLPPPEYCDQLSTARAKAVAEYLVGKGIPGEQVQYRGYGKRQPLYSNQTEDGRRRNQRVEIKILKM